LGVEAALDVLIQGSWRVGRSTTSAVVKSTFLVIVADAVFTAIFYFTVRP
jgi:ABC-type transporter Mla maintaining outer membrane lipid asymmetry permease subunit MlaE